MRANWFDAGQAFEQTMIPGKNGERFKPNGEAAGPR